MDLQGAQSFGEALHAAIRAAGTNQAKLAAGLGIDAGQVSRWVNNKAVPHRDTVTRIGEALGVDLSEPFTSATPDIELYVSAPITGLGKRAVRSHHDGVAQVVDSLAQHVNSRYWPGEEITDLNELLAADIATERNMKTLSHCSALLYLQFADIVRPSGALIELGVALGKKIKTTIILKSDVQQPYMLQGFAAVAANLNFLPQARIYFVEDVGAACSLVARNGRQLLGLA